MMPQRSGVVPDGDDHADDQDDDLVFSVNRGSAAAAGDGPDEPEPADCAADDQDGDLVFSVDRGSAAAP